MDTCKKSDCESAKKRVTTCCCVPQCNTYICPEISFHYFPKESNLKEKWELALRMGKSASKSMRVCSKHFTPKDYFPGGLKRHKLFSMAILSQNIPKRSHETKITSPRKRQIEARLKRVKVRSEIQRESEVAIDNDRVHAETEAIYQTTGTETIYQTLVI